MTSHGCMFSSIPASRSFVALIRSGKLFAFFLPATDAHACSISSPHGVSHLVIAAREF